MDYDNKSKKFYKELKRLKPNWADPKKKLQEDYIFVGSLKHLDSWVYTTWKEWGIELSYPTREYLNNTKQMRHIQGVSGKYEGSDGKKMLRLECVCGTQLLHSHIIADKSLEGGRGYVNSKLCLGSCCVLYFIDKTINRKHCVDCNSLEVKRKQVRCEECRVGRCQTCEVKVGKMINGNYYKFCYNCK
jgi:hypothetical protein